jgi:hypothetical protein
MTKAMHQTMIDQAKVFANTVQNSLIEALKNRRKIPGASIFSAKLNSSSVPTRPIGYSAD